MSALHSNSPDTAVVIALLRQAMELCRRLELPEEAATCESFIARFQRESPTYEVLQQEVWSLVNGVAALRILSKLGNNPSEFNQLQNAFSRVIFPEIHEPEEQRKRPERKAVRESETFWQLHGESDLYAVTIPDPPKAAVATTVRLTHSNSYGPFDDAEFFVRVGHPDRPTDPQDLNSATDWTQARLVEELVTVDDEEMLRSEADEPFEDEIPWEGTYDAKLVIPAGRRSIEVKIVSQNPELLASRVLTGWNITVG